MLNRIPKSFSSVLFGICIALMATPVLAEPEVYVLNTSTGAPYANKEQTGFQDLVIAEVFRRIGLKGRVRQYEASARALVNANANVDHGVAMRIKSLNKKYPNLVRVEERLVENHFVAYSSDLDLKTSNWKSLQPYSLAYIHGWLIFERNLVEGQQKHAVYKPDQMFDMLRKKRVDLVLYEQWQGLKRAANSGVSVKLHEPPLASVDMLHVRP
jgi:polar amino acid transport system substrate-binding protein